MIVSDSIRCLDFPCTDINRHAYTVPEVIIEPDKIRIFMISKLRLLRRAIIFMPALVLYLQTTLQAFHDAGVSVSGMQEILDMGVYITTAVNVGKPVICFPRIR
jgi:hypothetical protein